jgi:hypothetical protein
VYGCSLQVRPAALPGARLLRPLLRDTGIGPTCFREASTDDGRVRAHWSVGLAVQVVAPFGQGAKHGGVRHALTGVAGDLTRGSLRPRRAAIPAVTATGRGAYDDPVRRADERPAFALAYRGSTAPGRSARFVLTGPAGGSYTVPLAPDSPATTPAVTIVTDPVDLCRVAARRLDPAELDATVDGDHQLAELVLAGVGALARD